MNPGIIVVGLLALFASRRARPRAPRPREGDSALDTLYGPPRGTVDVPRQTDVPGPVTFTPDVVPPRAQEVTRGVDLPLPPAPPAPPSPLPPMTPELERELAERAARERFQDANPQIPSQAIPPLSDRARAELAVRERLAAELAAERARAAAAPSPIIPAPSGELAAIASREAAIRLYSIATRTAAASRGPLRAEIATLQRAIGVPADGLIGSTTATRIHRLTGLRIPGIPLLN